MSWPRSSPAVAGDPFTDSLLRRAIVALVALKVAGIIIVFSPLTTEGFDLPKSLWSRAAEWPMVTLLAIALWRYGTGIVPRTRLHWLVLAFLAVNVVAALFAENRYVALFGERARYQGLTFLGDMAVLYVAVAVAFRSRTDRAVLAAAIWLATVLAIAYALIQYVGADPVGWKHDVRLRPFGTLGNADYFGHLLGAAAAAGIGAAATPATRAALPSILAASLAVAGLFMVGLVGTRGAFVGIAAAGLVLAALILRRHGLGRASLARLAGGGAIVALLLVLAFTQTQVGGRIAYTLSGVGIEDRRSIYASALGAFAARPLVGYGVDGFQAAYARHREPGSEGLFGIPQVDSAHDVLLHAAATTGALGLAALLLLVGGMTGVLWRRGLDRDAAVATPMLLAATAYWTHALFTVGTIAVGWIPWVVFGATAVLAAPAGRGREVPRAVPATAVTLLCAAALVGVGSGFFAYQANVEARRALLGWEERNPEAVRVGDLAVQLDPGRADYWNVRGLAFDLFRAWSLAAESFEQAADRAPNVALYWSNLARSRAQQALAGDQSGGGREAAMVAAERGVAADPNYSAPHAALADIAHAFGDDARAAREALVAIELLPREQRYHETIAGAAVRMSDAAEARRLLEEALRHAESAPLRAALGRVALRAGDRDAARQNALRALELDPENAEARSVLASVGGA